MAWHNIAWHDNWDGLAVLAADRLGVVSTVCNIPLLEEIHEANDMVRPGRALRSYRISYLIYLGGYRLFYVRDVGNQVVSW